MNDRDEWAFGGPLDTPEIPEEPALDSPGYLFIVAAAVTAAAIISVFFPWGFA